MIKYKQGENWDKKIWFSSDLHLNHANICYPTSNWDNKEEACRKFNSVVNMNDTIINNINKYVGVEDHLYLLGDIQFRWKTAEDYLKLRNRINCQNITYIFGNHDNRNSMIETFGLVYDYLEIQIDGKLVCMMHYPIHEWNNRHKKSSYMVHGHSHGKWNKDQPDYRLDVGIDSAKMILGEYKPFSWGDVKKLLK